MLSIKDALLRVHLASTGAGYDFEVDGENVESVQVSRRINRRKDEGTIVINNDDGQFSQGGRQIQTGDRVDVFIAPQQAPLTWSEEFSGWGYGGWGGYFRAWSAFVKSPTYTREGPTMSSLSLEGTDYVFGILSNRIVFDAYESRQIAGAEDAILESVVGREAPEIDLSQVGEVAQTTSIVADGTNLLEFVIKLARRAGCVLWGYRDRLVFTPLEDLSPKFTVDPSSDIGNPEHTYDGGSLRNVVRVDGGTDHATADEMQQTVQDGYTTVTESNRAMFQVTSRKSQLERVELWTDTTGSEESISIRIQKNDGGAPVEPDNTDSDVDSKQLSYEFLADDGFTSFLMNDETLPSPDPWVLVETDGPEGQRIGVDTSTGTPAYIAHYPFPVSTQVRDGDSIEDHTRIEKRVKKNNLNSLDAARDLAQQHLDHDKAPESEASAEALSRRAHNLEPGEIVTFDMARERLVGDYIVRESEDTFEGNTYHTTLKTQDVESL